MAVVDDTGGVEVLDGNGVSGGRERKHCFVEDYMSRDVDS